MKKVYLITTKHLEDGLWFRDEEDFRVAMNYIALEVARHPEVVVLAFILMSNHTHFVLRGRQADVVSFVNGFKQRYSFYYHHKYGGKEFLRRNDLDVREIPYDDEAPERAVAYVLMNSVAANICAFCNQYPWGTGSLYFNPSQAGGRRLRELSVRECRRRLHSCQILPGNWIMGTDGYILPENYVDVKAVEALYRTPKRMNYFLNSSSKARKRLEMGEEKLPSFRDQIILAALPDLYRSLFQKDSFDQLRPDEQTEFIRQIRFRFSADINQIARVCGLTYAEAAQMIDSF